MNWEHERQHGRSRFIWRYGVLQWGPSVAVPWSLLMWYLQPTPRSPYWITLVLALVGFMIGGYFFGALLWRRNERRFAMEKVKTPAE